MVNGLAWRLMPGDPDVEDLVQDCFVLALDTLHRLAEPAAFSSWLGSIVVRQAHKRLRRKRLRMRLGMLRPQPIDPETLIGASAPPDVATELRAVYTILDGLPPEERIALVLRRVEGLPLADVAERMNLSLATVKRRLSAAEASLTRALGLGSVGSEAP